MKDIHKPNQSPYFVVVEKEVQGYVKAKYECAEDHYIKGVIQRQMVQLTGVAELITSDYVGEAESKGRQTKTSAPVS